MGCFLSGHQHTTSFALTCENDLTTGLDALVAAASASDPELDAITAVTSIDGLTSETDRERPTRHHQEWCTLQCTRTSGKIIDDWTIDDCLIDCLIGIN